VGEGLRFAYADPPYWKSCRLYGHEHGDGGCWDKIETHIELIGRLVREFPDGWAMSLTSNSLRLLLPLCPEGTRVASWVKPMCAGRPGIYPTYTWEPVVFCGGRKLGKGELWARDSIVANAGTTTSARLPNEIVGKKPRDVCRWIADLLGYKDGDELVDLFPGSGIMGRTLAQGVLL
jgi:hypothetical protein